jgi:hypothetical protein
MVAENLRLCEDCKHQLLKGHESPCNECLLTVVVGKPKWEPKEAEVKKECITCKYDVVPGLGESEHPCCCCRAHYSNGVCEFSRWEPKEAEVLKPCLAPGETLGEDGVVYECLKKWIVLIPKFRVSPDGERFQYLSPSNNAWNEMREIGLWPAWAGYRRGYAEGLAARDEA